MTDLCENWSRRKEHNPIKKYIMYLSFLGGVREKGKETNSQQRNLSMQYQLIKVCLKYEDFIPFLIEIKQSLINTPKVLKSRLDTITNPNNPDFTTLIVPTWTQTQITETNPIKYLKLTSFLFLVPCRWFLRQQIC